MRQNMFHNFWGLASLMLGPCIRSYGMKSDSQEDQSDLSVLCSSGFVQKMWHWRPWSCTEAEERDDLWNTWYPISQYYIFRLIKWSACFGMFSSICIHIVLDQVLLFVLTSVVKCQGLEFHFEAVKWPFFQRSGVGEVRVGPRGPRPLIDRSAVMWCWNAWMAAAGNTEPTTGLEAFDEKNGTVTLCCTDLWWLLIVANTCMRQSKTHTACAMPFRMAPSSIIQWVHKCP